MRRADLRPNRRSQDPSRSVLVQFNFLRIQWAAQTSLLEGLLQARLGLCQRDIMQVNILIRS